MKFYYHEEPSCALTKAALAAKKRAPWLRFPATAMVLMLWASLLPLAWLAVKAGNVGHAVAGWCGIDSREW